MRSKNVTALPSPALDVPVTLRWNGKRRLHRKSSYERLLTFSILEAWLAADLPPGIVMQPNSQTFNQFEHRQLGAPMLRDIIFAVIGTG